MMFLRFNTTTISGTIRIAWTWKDLCCFSSQKRNSILSFQWSSFASRTNIIEYQISQHWLISWGPNFFSHKQESESIHIHLANLISNQLRSSWTLIWTKIKKYLLKTQIWKIKRKDLQIKMTNTHNIVDTPEIMEQYNVMKLESFKTEKLTKTTTMKQVSVGTEEPYLV